MISIMNKRATICANGFTVRADGSRHKAQLDDNLQDAFLKVTKFVEAILKVRYFSQLQYPTVVPTNGISTSREANLSSVISGRLSYTGED